MCQAQPADLPGLFGWARALKTGLYSYLIYLSYTRVTIMILNEV